MDLDFQVHSTFLQRSDPVAAVLEILRPEYWPLVIALGVLVVAGLLYAVLGRVPNAFTFLAIAAGWATALAQPVLFGAPLGGGIAGSLICTAAGLLMLGKLYKFGLGAGCLKAQMAFGAWVGCALPWETALIVTAATTLWACAFVVLATIAWGRLLGRPVSEFKFAEPQARVSETKYQDELEDELDDESVEHIGDDGPPPFEVPAQAMLTVGTITGVLFFFWLDAQGPKPYLPHNQQRVAAQAKIAAGN
jgi:hypothetical protein